MCRKRTEMPQIDLKDYEFFLQYCHNNGVQVLRRTVAPQLLRSTQCWGPWRQHRVKRETLYKPVLSSGDHMILDGNTRWANAIDLGLEAIPDYSVQLDFVAALRLLLSFPRSYILDTDRANGA